jgi:hypothetical protein
MRGLRYFGTSIVPLAVCAVTASGAMAVGLPAMLGVKSPQSVTGASGVFELQTLNGLIVRCGSSSMEADLATENTGTFHIMWSSTCKASSPVVVCTGKDGTVKDGSGTILILGTFKIVHDVTETGNTYAILFELNPDTEYECSALAKIVALGSELCLIVEPTVAKESHTYNCDNNKTVGDPQETKYWFEMKEGTAALLQSLNGGTEESAAEVGSGTFVTVGSPNAVVMN